VTRIRELDGQGLGKAGIAAAAGVSESSVRNVLRPAGAGGGDIPGGDAAARPAADPAAGGQAAAGEQAAGGRQETLPVLPDPVARDAERALARFGLLGEGAVPVFTPGARYPLAGLLLALPALREVVAGGRTRRAAAPVRRAGHRGSAVARLSGHRPAGSGPHRVVYRGQSGPGAGRERPAGAGPTGVRQPGSLLLHQLPAGVGCGERAATCRGTCAAACL
jgi:hypothetical protein